MEDLSLHILDVVENSIRAGAGKVFIRLEERGKNNTLHLTIMDDGEGMDIDSLKGASDPFFTTKEGKTFGLGLSLLEQAALDTKGKFEINSSPGEGTQIEAVFNLSHPDMKPLGDIFMTVRVLRLSHPEVSFEFENVSDPD